MLTVEHVQKRYGSVQALVDANLDVQPGEIHALLGPNGAGKTTLIKILATLLIKDGGRVEILGHDLDQDPESIRHLVGYVGQDTERSAYARLTVAENLRFFGRLRGLTRREIDEQIDKLAGYFDFRRHLDKLFVTLSGGQKQTVVIMRAFLHDPPLIYLDEPTKGLDPIIAKRIRSFLRRLVQEEGKSLLLTSHVLSEVEELADRVSLI
ncbi:MAG: ABC transporter ATP-binding protein, partial [Caldilineae bacterium]